MFQLDLRRKVLVTGAILALAASTSWGTTIQDLVRVKGHERNVLTGMGIVVGLDGTGDSSRDSLVAARPYAELLTNLGNPVVDMLELAEADAYAIVKVTLDVPPTGAREGDRLDVSVETLFNATSLAGGRLVVSVLRPPAPDSPDLLPMAFGEGPVVIEGENPRSGTIHRGGQMLHNIRTNPVTPSGTMTLVLKSEYAGYPVAATLAGAVNDEFMIDGRADVAVVEDAANIRVLLPEADRRRPAQFIATLMTIPIDPSLIQTGARIVINEKEGIILVTGTVEIGPVGITHKGLSISSMTPARVPSPAAPLLETHQWASLDTTDRSGRNSTRLIELLAAFDQLQIPVEDQIAVIYELRKTGGAARGDREPMITPAPTPFDVQGSVVSAAHRATAGRPGAFATIMDQTLGGNDEQTARAAATAFVSSAFIMPVLASLRENSAAEGPFAPGTAEHRFGPMLDQQLADRIAGAARFPLVEAIVDQLRHAAPGAASTQYAKQGEVA